MSVSIYEIAREAGVSSSTVARALRGDTKNVRKDSIERVQRIRAIAERLGYEQSWRAKVFSSGRTHAIGLVHSHSDWIFEGVMGEVASAFTNSLRDLDYHLVLVPVDEQDHWQELLTGGRLDGIAILHHYPEEAREFLSSCDLPTVLLGDNTDNDAPHVITDDYAGATLGTRHLIELGHRRIAFYAQDSVRRHYSVDDRVRGFQETMEQAGLDGSSYWRISEQELATRLVSREDSPTAILCYCHVEAQILTQVMWKHHRRVPEDMSIIAFNDLPIAQYMSPPLATIGYDTKKVGQIGANLLASQIDDVELEQRWIQIPPNLQLRSSTAPLQATN